MQKEEIASLVAGWITETNAERIPESVVEKAKTCILDTIGVILAGAVDPIGKIAVDYANSVGGKTITSILGTSIKTAPPIAALVNGTMGHALDFDDITYVYHAHPSISVLPAALAAGEAVDAAGKDVLGAFIIGTEVASKLGAMVNPKLARDGWHSTCVMGAFGAAAAAGKLIGLKKSQLASALAIVASEASGIKGSIGSMCKAFQVGRSCENGVVAALFAKKGLKGDPEIFEKIYGFCHTFKVNSDFTLFLPKLGNPFTLFEPGFYPKEFPSCSASHPALNAMISLIKEYHIDASEVEAVSCSATPWVIASLLCNNPKSATEARFSMQFCLAAALLNRGPVRVSDFTDENVTDLKTVQLMKKISLQTSPELEKKGIAPADGPEAAIVEVSLKNGKSYVNRASFAKWRPDNMPSWETLVDKYRQCASFVLPEQKVERSIEQIEKIEQLNSVKDLMASITH